MVSNNSADLFPQRSQDKKYLILLSKVTLIEGQILVRLNKNPTHSSLLRVWLRNPLKEGWPFLFGQASNCKNETIHAPDSGNSQDEIFEYQKNVRIPCYRKVVQESSIYGETKRIDRITECDSFSVSWYSQWFPVEGQHSQLSLPLQGCTYNLHWLYPTLGHAVLGASILAVRVRHKQTFGPGTKSLSVDLAAQIWELWLCWIIIIWFDCCFWFLKVNESCHEREVKCL